MGSGGRVSDPSERIRCGWHLETITWRSSRQETGSTWSCPMTARRVRKPQTAEDWGAASPSALRETLPFQEQGWSLALAHIPAAHHTPATEDPPSGD